MKILSKGEGMPFDSAIALGMFDECIWVIVPL